MAAFLVNMFLLSLLIFQTALLEKTFGQEAPDNECSCSVMSNWCGYHFETRFLVTCFDITTEEKVRCAHQYLKDVTAHESFKELEFALEDSDLELFPPDFFENLPVTGIKFFECNVTKIPRSLIASACGTLATLGIVYNPELKFITENAFGHCPSLLSLNLYGNGIEDMSPRALYGLSNLEKLSVRHNKLTSFHGLEGISKLRHLNLGINYIEHIDKNAFQNMTSLLTLMLNDNKLRTLEESIFKPLTNSLVYFDLGGNPLNCDCSVKWLQDWSSNRISDLKWIRPTMATCSLKNTTLSDTDLSHCPFPQRMIAPWIWLLGNHSRSNDALSSYYLTPELDLFSKITATFLKHDSDREILTIKRNKEWGCKFYYDVYHYYFPSAGQTRIELQCTRSTDAFNFNLQHVQEYLQKMDTSDSDNVHLSVFIIGSDSDLFRANFLAPLPYPVKSLELSSADITQFPVGLISPVCDTLIQLIIHYSKGLKRIGEMVLANCSLLKDLDLSSNAIEDVSSEAFYGLTSLIRLSFTFNKLTSFNGLEGVPQLEELDLSFNGIKYIAKNAFQNLKRLRYIDVSNNALTTLEEGIFNPLTSTRLKVHFHDNNMGCTNYTKWLQDSSKEHHAHLEVKCSYYGGYRWDVNLKNVTSAKTYSYVFRL